MTITVTWMDGKQEDYRCEEYAVADGMLRLYPPRHGLPEQPMRIVPMCNVRIVTE